MIARGEKFWFREKKSDLQAQYALSFPFSAGGAFNLAITAAIQTPPENSHLRSHDYSVQLILFEHNVPCCEVLNNWAGLGRP